MKLRTSVQSILVIIFCIGLLLLSAGTYEVTSSTFANVVSHLERFRPTSFQFGNFRKAFLLSLRGKIIANILQFLAEENQNWCEKIQKNFQSCFTIVLQKKFLNKNVLNANFYSCAHFAQKKKEKK